ncbi:GntR family transcriptional regulator [Ensifer canadensis]|uniref:GntR family transcriptional regulator n=1 Tax=Ensifer canadensis TaxID=555315 RepID=UPI0035E3EFC7
MRAKLPELQISGRGDTLGDQVYSRLREAILAGTLKPGQKLSVRALATSLNVSLTPTRDALARLIAEDVLKQGSDRTVFVPTLDIDEIDEVFNLRCLLEVKLAEQALAKAPKSLAPKLRKIQSRLVRSFDEHDYGGVVARNFEFHFTLYEAARSKITLKVAENLWLRAGPMLNLLYPEFDRTRSGVQNHAAILECVEAGDMSRIGEAIQTDILGAKAELIRVVSGR